MSTGRTEPYRSRRLHLLVKKMTGTAELGIVRIGMLGDVNVILGQAHFIKTVEDLCWVVASSVPNAKFGLVFCESSGDCMIRIEGADQGLKVLARENVAAIGAGFSFIPFLRDCFRSMC